MRKKARHRGRCFWLILKSSPVRKKKSVPDQHAEVMRFAEVRVRYLDYHGEAREVAADGLLAIALQHEIDHLDGILYIDRISRLKRQMLLKKLQKMRAEENEE